jgi:hypothetical protein
MGGNLMRGKRRFQYVFLLVLGVALLFFTPFSFAADGCFIGENCTWYAYGVSGETGVNISFTFPNGSTSEDFSMVADGPGKYYYTTVHNLADNILGCATSFNSTSNIATSCESKQIYTNTSEDLDMIAEVLQPFLLAILGIALVVIGIYSTPILVIVGGIWFIGLASASFLGVVSVSIPAFGNLFFLMLGLLFVWLGIEENIKERK